MKWTGPKTGGGPLFDAKFIGPEISKWNYLWQSLLAGITVYLILLFLDLATEAVVVAALGSTAFVVWAMPTSITSQPRNVVGGQTVGVLSGAITLLFGFLPASSNPLLSGSSLLYFQMGIAVFLSVFIMVTTDTEHPPASGTAMGVVIAGVSSLAQLALFVIISSVILSLLKHLLKDRLKDLV